MTVESPPIAPVLTPHTLDVFVNSLRERGGNGRVSSLQGMKPLLGFAIADCFVPLAELKGPRFATAFRKLAEKYRPYRICLNFYLATLLGSELFFETYPRILREVLSAAWAGDEDKGISREDLRSILTGYLHYMEELKAVASGHADSPLSAGFLDPKMAMTWFGKITEFDFALTAVFLVMENAIPLPPKKICKRIVVSAQLSLHELTSFPETYASHRARSIPAARHLHRAIAAPRGTREIELKWLRDNRPTLKGLAGMWVVIEGNELVASDPDYEKARSSALRRGVQRPFIIRLPVADEVFMGV